MMILKKAILPVSLVLFLLIVASQHSLAQSAKKVEIKKGIEMIEQDWDKALALSEQTNKPVLLDIYATWCGPCKMLKRYTFSDEKVGNYFNANFINVSVDGEKGVGPELVRLYKLKGYPTLIVADSTGKPVLITEGYIPTDYILSFGKEALKRYNKN